MHVTQTRPHELDHWGIRLDHNGRATLSMKPFTLYVRVKDHPSQDDATIIETEVYVHGASEEPLLKRTSGPIALDDDYYIKQNMMQDAIDISINDARHILRSLAKISQTLDAQETKK